jgi:outer membrane protein OmpA-like peptidoglycan-associated protein
MSKKIIWIALAVLPFTTSAQLGGLMNKAKIKINQRVDSRIDREMDKALDAAEGKEPLPAETTNSKPTTNEPSTETRTVKGYSKFDFVPGERILYAEDFTQDAIGELPVSWNSSGKGAVMTLENQKGKWLRIFENTTYLSGNNKKFGENYTLEFDLMFYFEPKVKGYVLPGWKVGLFSSGNKETTDNSFLKEQGEFNNTEVHFGYGSYALALLESKEKRAQTFRSDNMELGDVLSGFNKIVHYSMQVQKTRFRLWIDDRKVFDIPRAINIKEDTLNQLYFHLDGSNYKEDEIGLFLSNIKIATGLPDTRHKLVEEGKFSTTGILFDVNAATIKPESNGVLKEIADAIKSNAGIKIKIIGHTDSDGSDADNLELSKKRAAAVKDALVKDWNIDAAILETDGKGEAQPVGDNKSKEGKAQNRRVEFVKL